MHTGYLFLLLCTFWWNETESLELTRVGDAILTFNMKLFKAVLEKEEGNVIISPASLYASLSMLQQGARGLSKMQLNNVLRAPAFQTRHRFKQIITSFGNLSNSSLHFANSVFIQNGFNVEPRYKSILERDFLSDIQTVEFTKPTEAIQDINSWVKNSTRNRIKQLITTGQITPDVKLLLTSAVYFKDVWANPFQTKLTMNKTFSPSPGKFVNVSTMTSQSQYLGGESHILGFKWLQIPYKDNRFSMLVLLPNEKYDLNCVLKNLPSRTVDYLLRLGDKLNVDLWLPKFNLSSEVKTIPVLKKMGLATVFNSKYSDLKGISENPLHVSDIIHKAKFHVDEEGATGSSATGIGASTMSADHRGHLQFHADHPFAVFVVDHQNNIPLFSGRVVDPSLF